MKKLLLISFLLMSSSCFSQYIVDEDTTISNSQILEVLQYQRRWLEASHNEFSVGTVFNILGSGGLAVGIAQRQDGVTIAGGILTFIGSLLWIDSHAKIGRASRWRIHNNSILYRF